jgi:epoxyqueuosine reductase
MSLTQKVKAEAHKLGFQFVGVTTPEPAASFPVYQEWIVADHHGEMGYLSAARALQRRADPRQILPECQSILVLGMHYNPPKVKPSQENALQGRVAAYAWNEDYHQVFKPRLQTLVEFIEKETGESIPNRWYTDTGPVLERDLAQRAGLGWVGKNGMLINPQTGSYFLLAEILLGIPLKVDSPFPTDHCGSCTRCIEACPTDCILPNRTLDARRCLSYLTIELKGEIPPELRPNLGNWVFGCDICQQVCPWNLRFATETQEPAFAPRDAVPMVDLVQELSLTPEAFIRKFKGSPVKRSKRRGYLRNVAVALGNSGDPAAIPVLTQALLEDPEPLVRGHAAWALGQIGGEEARAVLVKAKERETESAVLAEIEAAILLLS